MGHDGACDLPRQRVRHGAPARLRHIRDERGRPPAFRQQDRGTQGIYETTQIEDYLRNIIVSRFNDIMGTVMKTLLDLPSQYNEVGAGLKTSVMDDFGNLGLNLKALYITSITPPEEVSKVIDQRSGMGAVGDMQKYMQFQAAQAMGSLAQ